ncbi:MAG: M48 family metalloprotease [candidate division WOR-3 bacterium]|uniref:Protease HtpX homolog n=1 Tax=candidate division WOR-3 bacterium TaxID=2052148 RepID=A0A7C1NFB6_UNCW3|nr:M48 family metalloprotease [candidate division WOR-3 bacterium]
MTGHFHLYQLISRNKLKSAIFIIALSVLLGLAGYTLGYLLNWGIEAYILMGIFIIFYNLLLYYTSDKLALAVNRARPASADEYYELHNVVEEVALAAGIPKPRVYVVDDEAPNAFATGRNPENASVAVTTGLLQLMNREELQGVIAHEVAHIRNYDILLMTIVAIMGGLLILFRDIIFRWGVFAGTGRRRDDSRRSSGQLGLILLLVGVVLALISPILIALLRAAVSREREYLADATGAYIVRNPYGLANALRKIGGWTGRLKIASDATAHMFTANPFGKDRNAKNNLFATHPPLEERISRLEQLTF